LASGRRAVAMRRPAICGRGIKFLGCAAKRQSGAAGTMAASAITADAVTGKPEQEAI